MSKFIFFFFFAFTVSIPTLFSQVNLSNGLVGHYPFNGNANDISSNNNNGILQNNIQLTNDRYGNPNSAYFFDGVDDYISVADGAGSFSTPHFSLVLWFKTNSNNLQNLVGKRNFGPTNGQQYQFFINYAPFPGIGSNIISDANNCPVGITGATSYINSVDNICLGRWYCAVITFDGSLHKIYINGILKRSVASGFNTMSRCNSELRFGNWWQGDLIPYSGIMDDIRWYNRALNDDEIAVLSDGSGMIGNADFAYRNLLCQPAEISFNALSLSPLNVFWDFGDSETLIGNLNPVHTYNNTGIFNVRLITTTGLNCADTIIKPVDIRSLPSSLMQNTDTAICLGDSIKLRSAAVIDFCLSNNQGIINSDFPDPFVKPLSRTTYVMRASINNPNLITNGNFENGNTGFNSNYSFLNNRTDNGQYGIVPNPRLWYPGLICSYCGDHTNGTNGNMLVADGSMVEGNKLWNSNVFITPNTTYQISFWAIAYDAVETAQLAIFINDKKGGEWRSDATEVGTWKQYSTLWNSGSASSLNLYLSNLNVASNFNRFSIDDISVSRYETGIDSFTVNIRPGIQIVASDNTTICPGSGTMISVSGGSNYSWTPILGLSDPAIPNPVASPKVTTLYNVRSTNTGSCGGIDSVLITVDTDQKLTASRDTGICIGGSAMLLVSGGTTYEWFPSQGLSNTSIPNPIANPDITTTYTVSSKSVNGCNVNEEVKIYVSPQGKLFIPNAFTPNGDGLNDCFGILGSQGVTFYELAIYNRFGERVFYAKDPNSCWNGLYKSQLQPSGTFVYYLKMKSSCGLVNEKGTISLLR